MGLLQQTAGRADTQSRAAGRDGAAPGRPEERSATREDVAVVLRLTASMLRDIEAINAGADRAVLANPLLTATTCRRWRAPSPAIARAPRSAPSIAP